MHKGTRHFPLKHHKEQEDMDKREELLTENIWKLFIKFSVPAILGMLMYAIYSFVDAIFVGQWVGPEGLAAIAIVFPLVLINSAVAAFMGMGSASLLSRAVGAKDKKTVSKIFGNFTVSILIFSIIFMVLGFIFAENLVQFMGASGLILDYGTIYFRIFLFGAFFINFYGGANMLIRAEGHMKEAMIIISAGSLLNIFLDPIFIKVLGMGVEGAAVATVISVGVGAFLTLRYFISGVSKLTVSMKTLRFAPELMRDIAPVGFSGMAMQLMTVIQQVTIFKSIASYGVPNDLAIIGATLNMLAFAFIPLWGISQGLQPIIGMNYGAKKYSRVKESFRKFLLAATVVALSIWLIFMIIPHIILSLYIPDTEIVNSGINAFRIVLSVFLLYGFVVLPVVFFQSIGKGNIASFLLIARQVILFVPIVIILPILMGLNGVWIAVPISDALIVIISSILVIRELRRLGISKAGSTERQQA